MSNQAAADLKDALPINSETPQPIEVTLPEGEKGDEVKTEEQPKKRGRPPANLVISELKNTNADLLTANERLMLELDRERQAAREWQQKAADSNHQQMALHEAKLRSEATAARQELKSSLLSQDPDKQAEATAQLARAESGLADVEAWKTRNPPKPPEQQQPQKREAEQERPQQVQNSPPTQAWINENPWFVPLVNGRPNPDFNKTMHLHAIAFASEVEDKFRAEGRADDIEGPEYWDIINSHLADKFPGDTEEAAPPPKAKATVAPAVRNAPPTKATTTNKIQLSAEERSLVDNMRNSGAYLYPRGHKEAGQRMSPTDAYVSYWKAKQADQQGRNN